MKTKTFFIALAAFAVIYSACQQAVQETSKPDMAQIRAEIQAMEDAYAAGWKARDADAIVAAYYADDAISLTDRAPIDSGKDAIKQSILKAFASDTLNLNFEYEVVDVFAEGDLAVEVGKSVGKDSAGNVVQTGKYISVFQKRDGKYVCIRDAYNRDNE